MQKSAETLENTAITTLQGGAIFCGSVAAMFASPVLRVEDDGSRGLSILSVGKRAFVTKKPDHSKETLASKEASYNLGTDGRPEEARRSAVALQFGRQE
jgi:predicted outer membrane repeat protein